MKKMSVPLSRKMTWAMAIEQVLKDENKPLPVRKIAELAVERGYKLYHDTYHQTVSAECQRDILRFEKVGANTFGLSTVWLNREQTIQSMITVLAGSHISPQLRKQTIHARGGHCEFPGCKETTSLQVHHDCNKAGLFRDIVKKHRLRFSPDDPISNVLKGLAYLKQHPKFKNPKFVHVYCSKHHKEIHVKNPIGDSNGHSI